MANSTIDIIEMSIPDSDGAGPVTTEDSSTPPVKHPGFSYDDSTDEYIDLFCICGEAFDGAKNVELVVSWKPASSIASSVGVRWEADLIEIVDSSTDIDAISWPTGYTSATGVTSTAPTTLGHIVTATLSFASHGLVAGDKFHCRLYRDVSHAGDDMAGDAYVMYPRFLEAA